MAENKEELKSLLMRVKEKSRKVGLKLNIHKTNKGGRWEWKEWDFIFLGSKVTAGGDYSHEIKRGLLLGRKAMTDLDSVLKSRDITLPTKVPSGQSYGFSSNHIWMWELDHKEGWTRKNWCFQTVVLEKTLWVPWTARRSNQSILREINSEYSLEELMLKLKLQ